MSISIQEKSVTPDMYRAQFGEDKVLWQVFRQRPTGFFVEVGAYDGVTLSNTFFLEQMDYDNTTHHHEYHNL